MSNKYEKEIEEILKRADEVMPRDRPRPTKREQGSGFFSPLDRLSGGRRLRISAGKLMLVSVALLLLALILGATKSGLVVPLVVAGLVLFVVAYALFFVRPSTSSYEKRWRGRPIEDTPSALERLKRWLKG